MPKLTDLYPSKWLTAADLQNQEVVATISSVGTEEFEDNGKKLVKPVCNFQGVDKALILNKTNAFMIQEITGHDDTDNWVSVQVCLYTTMVQFGAKMTEAIRIKRPPAAPAIAPPAPVPPITAAPALAPMAPVENKVMQLGTPVAPPTEVEADPVDDSPPFGNPLTAG